MKAKLVYSAGATAAQVYEAIKLIVTGTTDVNALPAGIDKVNTTISIAIAAAGWSLFDDATGTNNQFVIRALQVDGTTYKYAKLTIGSSSLDLLGMEGWDATANTATNATNAVTGQPLNLTSGGTLHIFASARYLLFASEIGASWGNSNSITGLCEYSARPPTSASGFPRFAVANFNPSTSNPVFYSPRTVNNTNTTLTGSSAGTYLITVGAGASSGLYGLPSGANAREPNGAGGYNEVFYPIMPHDASKYAAPIGNISTISDIWLATANHFANLVIVTRTENSQQYVTVRFSSTPHHLLVPNG